MPESLSATITAPPPPLLRNLSFQLMWVSTAAAGFGDRMIELAVLPLLGFNLTGADASSITACVYFWFFLPWLFMTPVGGWLADTLPRRIVMLGCDQGRALLLFMALVLLPNWAGSAGIGAVQTRGQWWEVCLVVFAVGLLACIFSPARNAMIPQIVTARQLNQANAMILGIGVIASLIGYLIGQPVLDHSVRLGMLVGSATYFVSGWFFLLMKPRPHTGLQTDRELSEWARFRRAWTYLRQHRPVLNLILLNGLMWSMAMVVAPTVAALCKERYGLGADAMRWFAFMSATMGAGMLAGAGVVAWLNLRREYDLVLVKLLLLSAVAIAGLSWSRSVATGMVMAFGVGMFGGMVMIVLSTLTQAMVPNFILGRVTGLREVLCNLASVSVNLAVWQLPLLHRVNPKVPHADPILIFSLYPLAALLVLVAVWIFIRKELAGPYTLKMANFLWRLGRLYALVWHRLQWRGAHHVPRCGPVILAANHTTALDPMVMQFPLQRMATWLMLKEFEFPILAFMWRVVRPIALERDASDLARLRQVIQRLEQGEMVGIFPEGGLQRDRRELQPFAPGIGMIAVRSGATIVPVWIDGTPRKKKMVWHFLWPSRTTVLFGQAYKPDPKMSYEQITEQLRAKMLGLAATLVPPRPISPPQTVPQTANL